MFKSFLEITRICVGHLCWTYSMWWQITTNISFALIMFISSFSTIHIALYHVCLQATKDSKEYAYGKKVQVKWPLPVWLLTPTTMWQLRFKMTHNLWLIKYDNIFYHLSPFWTRVCHHNNMYHGLLPVTKLKWKQV